MCFLAGVRTGDKDGRIKIEMGPPYAIKVFIYRMSDEMCTVRTEIKYYFSETPPVNTEFDRRSWIYDLMSC